MNRDEAKIILLPYRPELADEADTQVAEALALAKRDPELAIWLEEYYARQNSVRSAFRGIVVPEGLKEQIIFEQAAQGKMISRRRNLAFAAMAVMVAGLILLVVQLFPSRPADDTFAVYRGRMVKVALRGYKMDLVTNNPTEIRNYFTKNQSPSDYVLPDALQRAEMVGCGAQSWQGVKVSMICFRTGKPLPPGQPSDLWLFVVDRDSVKAAPKTDSPQLVVVSRLITAVWSHAGKLYLLETAGGQQAIRQYL